MKRFFYISDDLSSLKALERELAGNGYSLPQMHVLSYSDAEVNQHQLNEVEAVLRKDVVRSMERGAVIGVIVAALVILIGYLSGLAASPAGWIPIIFLAVVLLGFCTWEGGFMGIQEPHRQFKRFSGVLRSGRHLFLIDVHSEQEKQLVEIVGRYPGLVLAGTGTAVPSWFLTAQNRWHQFIDAMP